MSLPHLIRSVRSFSLGAVLVKGGLTIKRLVGAKWKTFVNANRCTYPLASDEISLAKAPIGHACLSEGLVMDKSSALLGLAKKHFAHEFDLMGSGWVKVAYGTLCQGFEGNVYAPSASIISLNEITKRLSAGNRQTSSSIRSLISKAYSPIDWQLDFRSGYRWHEGRWSAGMLYGQEPGVDIKVPWELARMQHLPLLAMASDYADQTRVSAYRHECLDQILDFISANPPGYGVNWVCTMDVAIRAANIVMVCWLLEISGYHIEHRISDAIATSLVAHGRHIMENLEWSPVIRANHYLANICGLAFLSAALEPNEETLNWWNFAYREFFLEADRQFHPDGSNFEASTCYHRLSAEMVVYTSALIVGRNGLDAIPACFTDRLIKMAEFTRDVTKPNGRVAQIGDNDSGRMFKLSVGHISNDLIEFHLDHSGLITAINALLGRSNIERGFASEAAIVRALAGGRTLASSGRIATNVVVEPHEPVPYSLHGQTETQVKIPDETLLDGLKEVAYPDFGVYIWRSARFFLSIRCGSIGQNGHGGHAHNDQLAVELNMDGKDWLADPGSYTYTASIEHRNAYRSVLAHAAPRQGGREPAALNLGLFRLEDRAQGQCLKFNSQEFEGRHIGFGIPVHRAIKIDEGRIRIRDAFGGAVNWQAEVEVSKISSALDLRDHYGIEIKFSPGYGLL